MYSCSCFPFCGMQIFVLIAIFGVDLCGLRTLEEELRRLELFKLTVMTKESDSQAAGAVLSRKASERCIALCRIFIAAVAVIHRSSGPPQALLVAFSHQRSSVKPLILVSALLLSLRLSQMSGALAARAGLYGTGGFPGAAATGRRRLPMLSDPRGP